LLVDLEEAEVTRLNSVTLRDLQQSQDNLSSGVPEKAAAETSAGRSTAIRAEKP
jgi:hypothetical protein